MHVTEKNMRSFNVDHTSRICEILEESIIRIDDMVVLGRSSPDNLSDGRASVCVAGHSKARGFIRLYPTRMDSPLKVWNIVSVAVEKNPTDSRSESWKIKGSKAEWRNLSNKIDVVGNLRHGARLAYIDTVVSGCVTDLNDSRRSIGIVKPLERSCYLSERSDYDPDTQKTLYGGVVPSDKHSFKHQPRVHYRCSECKSANGHDQQILEWGVYEWFRKHPGAEEQVWENLFSKEKHQDIFFLVGNQARRLTSFMVISILRIPKQHAQAIYF